jgi:hypothetical protein
MNYPINIKFIGNIGVGKTTAICRLLNLFKDNKPILDTAAGRTTACDVHIWIREGLPSSILVDTKSNKEFEEILVKYIDKPAKISAELQTIIKNIVNLGDCEGINCFKEKMATFQTKGEFVKFCKQEARYSQRIEDCILNNSQPRIDDFSWIKENFNKINTGKHKSFGIPKKITINIDSKCIYNYNEWFRNKCIIDTKGIEVLNHQKNSKFVQKEIYCSSFCNGPENIIFQQIRNSQIDRNNKFILVLPKYNEPENVNGADGNYEVGVKIKLEEFVKSTKDIINRENILFFDSNEHTQEKINEIFNKINKY